MAKKTAAKQPKLIKIDGVTLYADNLKGLDKEKFKAEVEHHGWNAEQLDEAYNRINPAGAVDAQVNDSNEAGIVKAQGGTVAGNKASNTKK